MKRRDLMKVGAFASVGIALAATPAIAMRELFPAGVFYTKDEPGMWKEKVATHAPSVRVQNGRLTIETQDHPMVEDHFIVRHTLVDSDGKVLGYQTFSPGSQPKSVYADPGRGLFYATSFCSQHDFWVTKVEL